MGFSLTEHEIKQLCIKKVMECTGLKMKSNHIQLVDYGVRDNDQINYVNFYYCNPYVGIGLRYGINWDRNEILISNISDAYIGGFLKHNGGY